MLAINEIVRTLNQSSTFPSNKINVAATVDEEIPEEIESYLDETREIDFDSGKSTSVLSVTAPRNLPGSAWLQTKRAQVNYS